MAAPPPTRLLLGTSSRKKLGELVPILGGAPLTLVTPADLGLDLDVEETGHNFRDNAILKANAFARAAGLPALADDSGLEVDALHGAPGVRSARYAGPGATDADRIALLLRNLDGVPAGQRTARFRCTMALATPEGLVGTVDGACEGEIAFSPRGSNGFGYDPVFLLPHLGRTMAELEDEQKHAISHRGRAGRAALDLIERWLAEWSSQRAGPPRHP
jgi:XTP/dITP diphosphohydrolase